MQKRLLILSVLAAFCAAGVAHSDDDLKNRTRNLFKGKSEGSAKSRSQKSSAQASSKRNAGAGSFDAYQKAMLKEVNFARTDPSGYAKARLSVLASKSKDNGAFADLSKRSPVPPLVLEERLCNAAQKYSKFMAQKNIFGHNGNGSPFDRMKTEGYEYSYAGENIACGSYDSQDATADPELAAKTFTVQLIVDEGVASLGHRKNILSPDFTEIGVGFWQDKNSDYGNYTVQDFGKPLK